MPVYLLKRSDRVCSVLHAFVPKTGGTSLMRFFEMAGAQTHFGSETKPISGVLRCASKHFHYAMLEQMFDLARIDLCFTVVRHPVDRLKSDYLWARDGERFSAALPDFDRWANWIMDRQIEQPFILDNHIRPQHEFVGPHISQVYRYEDGLEAAARDVLARLGIELKLSDESNPAFIPRLNVAGAKRGTMENSRNVPASPATVQRIKDFYRTDFERFYPDAV